MGEQNLEQIPASDQVVESRKNKNRMLGPLTSALQGVRAEDELQGVDFRPP